MSTTALPVVSAMLSILLVLYNELQVTLFWYNEISDRTLFWSCDRDRRLTSSELSVSPLSSLVRSLVISRENTAVANMVHCLAGSQYLPGNGWELAGAANAAAVAATVSIVPTASTAAY